MVKMTNYYTIGNKLGLTIYIIQKEAQNASIKEIAPST
jgi:hypothetical protein